MKVSVRKILILLSLTLMFASFSLAQPSFAQTEAEEDVEVVEPCTPEESQIELEVQNEATFVTGGIGLCESQEMRRIAKEYQLELVFAQKTPTAESYLANIPVEVIDSKGSYVIDTVTKGPYLLAKLPNGRYNVVATFNGETKSQIVSVSAKHQRVVFVWRVDY